jgi:hypothetical protein
MSPAAQYRALAADCEVRAQRERVAAYCREWEYLAYTYRQLARQAEREGLTATIYEAWTKTDFDWPNSR